ncbi:MAG: lamin tail domain-containing protein, partial [Ferruginibacter sp.]
MNVFTHLSRLVTTLIICFFSFTGIGQISLTSGSYIQNFNTLASSGSANPITTLPTGWTFIEAGTGANTNYSGGTGSSATGDTYSFGTTAAERAFGSLISGSVTPTLGAAFTNNSGSPINSISVSYTGEQWRLGATGRLDKLDFQYSLNATSINSGTWIDADALDFAAPVTSGTVGALDGNTATNRTSLSATIGSLNIPNGSTFFIRWNDFNPSGSDDGLGVDDFSISFTNPSVSSAGGIFESYIILNYGGSDVYYDMQASTGNPDFTGSLGTFNSSQVFKLSGFEQKVYKCGSLDITDGYMWYRIYPAGSPSGSFSSLSFAGANNIGGAGPGCQNQQWFRTNSNLNLLNGLCDGNYTIEVYTSASYTGDGSGTFLANNSGANYTANFSVNNASQSGIYQNYAIVNGNYYDLLAATGNPDFNGADLGSFCSNSSSLTLGGQNKVYKCPPNDITANFIYYRVYTGTTPSGSFAPLNLPYVSPAPETPGAGCTNQLWESVSASTNILTGLAAGTYTLEIYSQAVYNSNGVCGGFHYANNSGANYKATFTVTTPPVLSLPANISLNAGASCNAVATYTATATGAPAPTITYSTASGSSFPVGTTTVNVTATNSCGTATGSFTVTVTDNTAPVITTNNTTVNLDASGNAGITAANVTTSVTDNCGVATTTVSPAAFTCSDVVAPTTDLIISEYLEGSGNNKAIEIYNGTPSGVNLANYAVRVYSNGATTFTSVTLSGALAPGGTYIVANPSANAAIQTVASSLSSVISFNGNDAVALAKAGVNIDIIGRIGENPGTAWTSGSLSTIDRTLIRKNSVTQGVSTTSGTTGFPTLATEWDAAATDFTSNLGTRAVPVTITVTDVNGNTATAMANVTVIDNLAPVAPSIANATGECSVTVTAPTATDNCSGTVTGTTAEPLTYNTQGTYTINWTFTDASGNSSTATQTVVVDDVTAPVAPTLSTVTGECSASVTAPVATDNCAGPVTGTTSDPLTYTAQGTYTVNWSFDDGNGNVSTAAQTVVVDDVTAPDVPVLADATGECSVTLTAPETTDNCVFGVVGTTTDPLTYNTQGSYIVHWTFNDGNGNISTATQNVIVDDVIPPATPIIADATGECSVTVTAPIGSDACVGNVIGTTTNPLTYNTQGTYVITWSFNDGNGNISTATQNVIVDDITAPDVPVLADAVGECSVTVTAPETTDNCVFGVVGTTTDPLAYTIQGSYVITWTFDDGNGNISTATQNVVVDDVTPPATPILSDATGECSVAVTAPSASDNCAGTITGTTTDPLSYTAQGTYTVTWSFDDGNGNVSTATQTVVVDDVTPPATPILSDATGECTVSVTAPTTSDNCVGTVTGTTTDPLTYNTQGTYTVTWSFDDGNGNVSTATQTVVVDDVTAPVVPTIA